MLWYLYFISFLQYSFILHYLPFFLCLLLPSLFFFTLHSFPIFFISLTLIHSIVWISLICLPSLSFQYYFFILFYYNTILLSFPFDTFLIFIWFPTLFSLPLSLLSRLCFLLISTFFQLSLVYILGIMLLLPLSHIPAFINNFLFFCSFYLCCFPLSFTIFLPILNSSNCSVF